MALSLVQRVIERGANLALAPFGYRAHLKLLDEQPEGFSGYVDSARQAGMDVNDWEEQVLGWRLPLPTLQQVLWPYLREDSTVCEIGPGSGRWSRHIVHRLPRGRLHLVDSSPWLVRFLRAYFRDAPQVQVHLGDGLSLPLTRPESVDVVFSANTFVELKLGAIYLYLRDAFRVLVPGGMVVVDYVDPTTAEGWEHLLTQGPQFAHVYTFHAPAAIDHVFAEAGLTVLNRCQVGKSTFVMARKPPASA